MLTPRIDERDIQRIATALKANEWATVSSALGWLETLSGARTHDLGQSSGSAAQPGASGPRPQLSAETLAWLEETFERLDAARWTLRRLSAAIPSRWPIRGVTRVRWRAHDAAGLKRTEIARAVSPEAHEAIRKRPDLPTLTQRQLRRRRYRGVHRAREWEERDHSRWARLQRWAKERTSL